MVTAGNGSPAAACSPRPIGNSTATPRPAACTLGHLSDCQCQIHPGQVDRVGNPDMTWAPRQE